MFFGKIQAKCPTFAKVLKNLSCYYHDQFYYLQMFNMGWFLASVESKLIAGRLMLSLFLSFSVYLL